MRLLILLAGVAVAQDYRFPVIGNTVVTAYYDLGGNQDWNCGNHTYGGHRGTDLGIVGRFAAQDEGRNVVAAAGGRVIRTHDGEFDRCTTGNCAGGGGFGNLVVLEHPDGKQTYYAHLRNGSVRVNEGQQVDCGQVLGQVGSSGFSTGPHLHFEVRVNGSADDPFTGPCGGPLSYWRAQGAYRALPGAECEPVEPPEPPPAPDLHLSQRWSMPERRCDFDDCLDFIRGGRSAGVPDAWVEETLTLEFRVRNQGMGSTAAERPEDAAVEVAYDLPGALEVVDYVIETDHPARDQQSWQRNDAMDNPANPAPDALPPTGRLRLNSMGAGESKRVLIRVRAANRSVPAGVLPLRFWVVHMREHYGEKPGWGDAPEHRGGQSFNGGDLRVEGQLDVFDKRHFEFDGGPGLLEGWRSCAEAPAEVLDEALAGADCVESPPLDLPVDGWPGLRLELAGETGEGVLEWGGGQLEFHRPGGRSMLHLAPAWSGDVDRLRLRGAGPLTVYSLRIVQDAPPERPDAQVPSPAVDAGPPTPARDAGAEWDAHFVLPDPEAGVAAGGADAEGGPIHVQSGCQSAPAPWAFGLFALLGLCRRLW